MLSPTQNVSVIDVHALAHRQDEAAITRLITTHGCEHLYLDVGSNIGVQIRKLFEPHKYPGAPVHSLFDASFGAAAGGGRCRVCAIGVEPNPRHRSRLGQLQRRLSAAGAGVMIFEAAAGATDGVASLQFGARKSAFEDAGASALGIGRYTGSDEVLVRMLRLSRIVSAARAALGASSAAAAAAATVGAGGAGVAKTRSKGPRGQILMKLDVEGSEWTVLPDLMQTGALCAVDQIFAEYHDADFDRVAGPAVKQQLAGRRMAPSPAREGKRRGGGGGGGGGSGGGVAARLKRAAMRLMGDVVRSLRTTMDAELGGGGGGDGGSGTGGPTRPLRAGGGSCATRVVSLDDETFVRDRAAWPTGSVCGA